MTTSPPAVRGRARAVLEPVVAHAGYDLEEFTITPAGRRRVVRVMVDRDGGVSLDDVADVTRDISIALDASEVLGETPYVLEVSSPGVDRPLRESRHWRRAVGRLVRVSLAGGGSVTGRVVRLDDDVVLLHTEDGEQQHRLSDLGPGAVQVEFSRAPSAVEGD